MDPRSLSNKKTGGNRGQAVKAANAARPMILSDEEKHQLIMAHAANRKPTDRVSQLSLVAGVFICALAIGLGWLYSVRQSMAKIFPTAAQNVRSGQDMSLRAQYERQIRTGADSMIQQVEKIENEQLGGGLDQLIQTSLQLASTTNMLIASPTQNTVRTDLIRQTTTPGKNLKKVNLPQGVVQD